MGKIIITLEKVMKERNLSKYRVCRDCNMQQTQLNQYLNNNIKRIDLDVITRLCDYLQCDLSDIIKYQKK